LLANAEVEDAEFTRTNDWLVDLEVAPCLRKGQCSFVLPAGGKNIFEALMEVGKVCGLGSMSHAMYEVGGEYRRNR